MLFNLFHFLISYMCRWFGVQDNAGIDPAVPGVNRYSSPRLRWTTDDHQGLSGEGVRSL